MSFSDRQLHCLEAMGLVAWTSKGSVISKSAEVSLEPVALLEQQQTQHSKLFAASHVAMPSSIDQLGQWVVRQPVLQMTHRGSQISCIGSDQAALMVVCLQLDTTDHLPLSRECAQLFDLMMRAIDTTPTDYRQCAISAKPLTKPELDAMPLYLDDILTLHTRAVLVLDPHPGITSDAIESDMSTLADSSLPLWRVPHPALLLATPELKRRAWQALKGLKLVLNVR